MGKLQTRLSRNIILTRKVGVCHFAVSPTICSIMHCTKFTIVQEYTCGPLSDYSRFIHTDRSVVLLVFIIFVWSMLHAFNLFTLSHFIQSLSHQCIRSRPSQSLAGAGCRPMFYMCCSPLSAWAYSSPCGTCTSYVWCSRHTWVVIIYLALISFPNPLSKALHKNWFIIVVLSCRGLLP